MSMSICWATRPALDGLFGGRLWFALAEPFVFSFPLAFLFFLEGLGGDNVAIVGSGVGILVEIGGSGIG